MADEGVATRRGPGDVDEAAVRQVVTDAFAVSSETDTIDALLVAKGGELVFEEYIDWIQTELFDPLGIEEAEQLLPEGLGGLHTDADSH